MNLNFFGRLCGVNWCFKNAISVWVGHFSEEGLVGVEVNTQRDVDSVGREVGVFENKDIYVQAIIT